MIIKRIDSGPIDSKSGYVMRLTRYILSPGDKNRNERAIYCANHGFVCDDLRSAQQEMAALADGAKSSANPSMHLIISWQEGEQPTALQVDESVRILLEELGLQGHGVIYALHLDTDNLHCHVAISRVNPITEKVTVPNHGFDLEAIHKAIAKIEWTQGWQREARSRYEVLSDGRLVKVSRADTSVNRPKQKRRDMEHRTGEMSAQRIAIEKAGPILVNARSWEQMHSELHALGMRYEKTGSGAVVFVADVAVKASSVHRAGSLTRMQRRLGPYQPFIKGDDTEDKKMPDVAISISAQGPMANRNNSDHWQVYIRERKAHLKNREQTRSNLRTLQESERHQLQQVHRAERQTVLGGGSWTSFGLARKALRSILAAQQASQKAALKTKQQSARLALQNQFPAFPDYEGWLREHGYLDTADSWRYRYSRWPSFKPAINHENSGSENSSNDIRSFAAHALGRDVHYSKIQMPEVNPIACFIDRGSQIDVCSSHDDESILAAMQLAAQKWGGFVIEGSDDFSARCVALAAQHGMGRCVANPELKVPISDSRKQYKQNIQRSRSSEAMNELGPYLQSMQALSYQLTVLHERSDGTKALERMWMGTGEHRDADSAEFLQASLGERMELRGKSLSADEWTIEPHFDDRIALRLKGLSSHVSRNLSQEGFHARTILEVEPGCYEWLITVPTSGLSNAQKSVDAYARLMKFKFDITVEICGCGNTGHALPGGGNSRFQNHFVKVQAQSPRDCTLTSEIIEKADSAIRAKANIDIFANASEAVLAEVLEINSERSADSDFTAHRTEILRQLEGKRTDASRVDAQVALRLKMTGHDKYSVAAALMKLGPNYAAANEVRDWSLYAKRAVDYAWGPAGKQQEQLMLMQLNQIREVESKSERPKERSLMSRRLLPISG